MDIYVVHGYTLKPMESQCIEMQCGGRILGVSNVNGDAVIHALINISEQNLVTYEVTAVVTGDIISSSVVLFGEYVGTAVFNGKTVIHFFAKKKIGL